MHKTYHNNLLALCKYYKGEDICPYNGSIKAYFWGYEHKWCDLMSSDTQNEFLNTIMVDYILAGLLRFNEQDGVHIFMKAILFNRYSHWIQRNPDDFKKWYIEEYLSV